MNAITQAKIIILLLCWWQFSTKAVANPPSDFPEIRIYIPPNQFTKLQKTKGDKLRLDHVVVLINHDTTLTKEIHTRGNNSLKFKRKSFSVELEKSIHLKIGNDKVTLKKFNLLNLVMDKNLWRNRFSNLNLNTIGLFPLFNIYCKVWINDQPQGYYLLIEKPQQVRTKLKSPYMLRRGLDHSISDEYFDKEDKLSAREYRKQFESIYSTINSLKEQELANQLQKLINMDSYSRFLAFNYLLMNGDYADEVFLYIDPQHHWFEVIPWDYDDILRPVPHEGRLVRNEAHADKKIFSLEEKLDRAIAGNNTLYQKYEILLKHTLIMLDSAKLSQSAYQVINELEQLNHMKELGEVTLFLDQEPFNFEEAKADIITSLTQILKRREWILAELK
jgi:spore coat protein H